MNFKNIPSTELISNFENCVRSERKITAQIIKYIAEIDRRRLFIEKGFTSLFDYLVKNIGYSPGAAMRRIDAARLLQEIPEVIDKLESGSITLSQATQLQKASRDYKKTKHSHLTTDRKRELFFQIENTNQKNSEKVIAQTLDLPIPTAEKETLHRNQSVTLTITFTKEQMDILETAQNMISHVGTGNKWADTITYLAQKEVKRRTTVRTKRKMNSEVKTETNTNVATTATASATVKTETQVAHHSRYIPQAVRKQLLHPHAKCSHTDHLGRPCDNRRFLQIDHIKNYSRGGVNTIENLQVLCGVHNRLKYMLDKRDTFLNTRIPSPHSCQLKKL